MLTSKRHAAFLLAALMFVLVVLLRIGASESLDFGPQDVARFADHKYGFDLQSDTPPFFLTWSRGDGQAFMSVAADLNGDGVSAGLGLQSYRMTRIGHSALARILVLGDRDLLPYGLAAASFLGYAGLLGVAVKLTDAIGLRALVLGLSPAAIIATVFDTSEGFGSLLLSVGLTASTLWPALVAGVLLGITRPSFGTAILASRQGALVPAATIAAGLGLQMLVMVGFHVPFSRSGGTLVVPFSGYVDALPSVRPAVIASGIVVLLMASILVRYAFDSRFVNGFRLAAGVSAALAISVGPSTFVGPMSPLRVSGALVVLLVLSPLFERERAVDDTDEQRAKSTSSPLGARQT